jgi:glucose-1-phosphate thymidylyltransferase
MRALILSGGEGSRLRPITYTSAKQLIPIAGEPILFRAIRAIRDAGISEIGIVVGATADEVRSAVGDGSRWGARITYIDQDAPLGLAHAVLTAREFVAGEPFLMYLGDNVLLEGLTRFVDEFERTRPNAQIFLARVPEPERFGVAVLDGERVVRLVEKPSEHISDLALVGVYLFDDTIVEAAQTLRPSWRGELEITEAIQWLIDHDRVVRAEMVSGWWKDTGKPDDLLEANRILLDAEVPRIEGEIDESSSIEGSIVVQPGAKVVGSHIVGPSVIGEGSLVEDSRIGPWASIGEGCTVVGSAIEDSIVLQGCTIRDVGGLAESILGKHVEVRHAVRRDGKHRLIVGIISDRSRVEVD